ncbi:MAG: M36 family metallopeptidase [Bacteroidota bacterium]
MKKLLYTFAISCLVLTSSAVFAQSQTNLDKGMRFIEQNAQKWGLQESDYIHSMVSDMYTNTKTGVTYIYLIQSHEGIPIHNAITPIAVDAKGKVHSVKHGYIPNAKSMISETQPSIAPVGAIKSAAANLGIKAESMPSLTRSDAKKNIYQFGKADFAANEIEVKLVYLNDGDQIKLAWNLAIDEIKSPDFYNLFVDANSGEVISKFNNMLSTTFQNGMYTNQTRLERSKAKNGNAMTLAEANVAASASMNVSGGTYTVFPLPAESPIHGELSTVVDPHFPDASPFGWHDINGIDGAEFNITRGNNVHAYLDKTGSNFSMGDEPNGGDDLIFDFPYDPNNQPDQNEQTATVNLFYMCNMIHDISKRLGFDEQAGNFQLNNYGNGGSGNDHILAEVADGFESDPPNLNNANYSIVPDGISGRIQMFMWDNPSGVLSIDEPEVLSGFVSDVGDAQGTMGFGGLVPDENGSPITGKIVIAREDAPGEPTTVCGPLANAEEVAGNIALIDRGLCDFSLKTWHAQEAGAISVIICNVVGGGGTDGLSSFGMAGGERADEVTIVPISLGKPDCDRIRASILSDIDVTVTIQNRGPVGPAFLDASFDHGVTAHEYGHGISTRIVGGPSSSGCLTNLEQAGEGISDFFALAFTVEEGDQGSDLRGVANYADGQNVTGTGIRSFPYSTDMNANPLVYDDVKTRIPEDWLSTHAMGEIWAVTMWDVYWAFVNEFGLDTTWDDEDSGNYKAVRLAIEGLKLSPCSPSYVDLRDGILQADSILYDAAHSKLLWVAFAKRGLGYLADDGGDVTDPSNGTQSFEPFPLVIQELKINAKTDEAVEPGDEITVELNAVNHIPETQTGVVITVSIPDGLEYVDGSASLPATFVDGELEIPIGEMDYQEEITITYRALTSGDITTKTLYYDNVDDADQNAYEFGSFEGFNLWLQSFDVGNSGSVSWWASQIDVAAETDFWMTMPPLDVVGNRPALRFANRFDTEIGADAGFIQISRDGKLFEDVKDKFIRNGYNSDIQYATFAIPLLEAFSGTTNEEWIDTYLDLSDYNGEQIFIRFRFGTDDNTGVEAAFPGWFVDDLEMVDLRSYESVACITSENSEEIQCSDVIQIYIESDQMVDTSVDELEGFNISVAPNPASEYVSVGVSAEANTPIQLMLTSIDGAVVQSMNMVATTNQSIRTFNTSDLQKGIYLIQIRSEKGLTTKKVIIQ